MKDYRFVLSYKVGNNEYTHYANAIFGDDLAMVLEKASNEEYYRTRLNGKVTFLKADYAFIMSAAIDKKITCNMQRYQNGSWSAYMSLYFYRTDCEVNVDDKIIVVEPKNDDGYDAFLGAIDKEYDLIRLAPTATPVMLDKRPCLQIYALSADKLTCVLSGMSWEQDCKEITDENDILDYGFAKWGDYVSATFVGSIPSGVPTGYAKKLESGETGKDFSITKGGYTLKVDTYTAPGGGTRVSVEIIFNNQQEWFGSVPLDDFEFPIAIQMAGAPGTGNPDAVMQLDGFALYGRWICDSYTIMDVATSPIPANDITDNNRNYTRVAAAEASADMNVIPWGLLLETPTQWGIYQPGLYYGSYSASALPICRSMWGRASLWLEPGSVYNIAEESGRAAKTLNDAYLLTNVISILLKQYDSSSLLVSTFLSGTDPLDSQDPDTGRLYITPKSNILNINYTQPAQKAPITLRQILDMLRTTYKCYWYLYGTNLRIEHIEYFRRGGSYSGTPSVGADLTNTAVVRSHKRWDYQTSKYTFDKVNMPCQMEFAYMDESTEPFEGLPVVMLSNYVDMSRVDKNQVAGFSADIDYLMLNPSGASKDGFVVMKADEYNNLSRPIKIAGETGDEAYLMVYPTNGEQIVVHYNCRGAGRIQAIAKRYAVLEVIDEWNTDEDDVATVWTLPPGTDRIEVVITADGYFELTEMYSQARKVKYWDWVENNVHHVLQNGTLSFSYLHRYYAYDMPCKLYKIGSEEKTAIGVAKNKIQDVSFPTDGTFDTNKVVTTTLGNGKLRKLSLNLSSQGAKATLEYDTE